MEETKTENQRKAFFKRDPLTTVVLVAVIFLASQLLAGLIISIYPSLKNWTGDQSSDWLKNSIMAQFAYILLAESLAIWAILKLLKKARVARERIGLVRPKLVNIVQALSGYGVYFVSFIIVIMLTSHFLSGVNLDQQQQIGFESAGGGNLYLVFISLAVLPPIAEEIIFRGLLFSSLRQKAGFIASVIPTSLLFGLAHLQFGSGAPLLWTAAIDTFLLSCVLCYLREKSASLWPSIMLHFLKNTVAFIALFHAKF